MMLSAEFVGREPNPPQPAGFGSMGAPRPRPSKLGNGTCGGTTLFAESAILGLMLDIG